MMNKILKRVILAGLFIIPFVPLFISASFFFPFITTKAFAWRIIVEVVLALWVVLAVIDPAYRPKKSYILWSLVAFLVVIGLADLFGVNPVKSFWSNYERMEGYITLLHLGAAFIVMASVFSEKIWRWWWNTWLGGSLIMVIYCIFQLAGVLAIHQSGSRVDGTLGNAAYLGVYMLIGMFIAALYFIRSARGSFWRWAYAICFIAQGVILYYTATRGAILGFIGGLILVAILNVTNNAHPRAKKVSIAILTGTIVIVGAFFALKNSSLVQKSPVLSRFASITPAELQTEGRSFIWPMALQGIKERPILGWGQDNFNYVFDEHYSPLMYNLEPWFDRAHNIFLDWGVSGGILGLLSYLSLYAVLLWVVWKKDLGLSRLERSIITGLLAGYFFNNLFVFDNLISYILFIALLAYIHGRVTRTEIAQPVNTEYVWVAAVPTAIIFALVLYFVNIQPIIANATLIKGFQAAENDPASVLGYFQSAYNETRLGRPETVEYIAADAPGVLGSSISTDQKNAYYTFAKQVIEKQAADFSTDARYQLIAGTFFGETGSEDEALQYLQTAKKLMPGKQQIYFEIADVYINNKDYKNALTYLKQAYDMAPDYSEAQVVYLLGTIYAGDHADEQAIAAKIDPQTLVNDDRITSALYATGQFGDLISILKERVIQHPTDPQSYAALALAYYKAGDKTDAVAVMQTLEQKDPSSKTQVDAFIQQIKSGTLQ